MGVIVKYTILIGRYLYLDWNHILPVRNTNEEYPSHYTNINLHAHYLAMAAVFNFI